MILHILAQKTAIDRYKTPWLTGRLWNRIPLTSTHLIFPENAFSSTWKHCSWFWGRNHCRLNQVSRMARGLLGMSISFPHHCSFPYRSPHREFCSLTLQTSPLSALLSLERLLDVSQISNNVVWKLLVSLPMPWMTITSGLMISTNMVPSTSALQASNSLS